MTVCKNAAAVMRSCRSVRPSKVSTKGHPQPPSSRRGRRRALSRRRILPRSAPSLFTGSLVIWRKSRWRNQSLWGSINISLPHKHLCFGGRHAFVMWMSYGQLASNTNRAARIECDNPFTPTKRKTNDVWAILDWDIFSVICLGLTSC